MSVPVQNIQGNMIQSQNIVINQVPLTHTMITNVNPSNGIPIASAIAQSVDHHQSDLKQTMIVEAMPIHNSNIVQSGGISSLSHVKPSQSGSSTNVENAPIVSKQRLQDIIRDTDPTLNLEDEVEEIILNYVDEFIDKVLNGAALIAKNRHVSTIEVKDVQQYLTRNYDMWTPGFGTDELKTLKRSFTTESHKQRLALIKKTLKKY
ncbi:transcription initiation factor TFIID subunit 12 [Coccinella septempunctata]|uniref:transcription initiation factor TFIID subunit 12 n=1 Tax=Coccinella septempunctata TaxID=41139 RepID=UPI001D091DC9|nr:transcription initiation factor TFIID subunit 12 [Coccinella septempunctata]